MKKINLFIIDNNETYLKRLREYVYTEYRDKVDIHCFTNIDIFAESIENEKNRDILMVSRDM